MKRSGIDPTTIDEVPKVIKTCKACQDWQELPPKANVNLTIAEDFNDEVWCDLVFVDASCEDPEDDEPRSLIILHMWDDATEYRMCVIMPAKTPGCLKIGLLRWVEIFGFPYVLRSDLEGGLFAEEMKVWLEYHNCKLKPFPAATGSRHTGTGRLDVQSKLL